MLLVVIVEVTKARVRVEPSPTSTMKRQVSALVCPGRAIANAPLASVTAVAAGGSWVPSACSSTRLTCTPAPTGMTLLADMASAAGSSAAAKRSSAEVGPEATFPFGMLTVPCTCRSGGGAAVGFPFWVTVTPASPPQPATHMRPAKMATSCTLVVLFMRSPLQRASLWLPSFVIIRQQRTHTSRGSECSKFVGGAASRPRRRPSAPLVAAALAAGCGACPLLPLPLQLLLRARQQIVGGALHAQPLIEQDARRGVALHDAHDALAAAIHLDGDVAGALLEHLGGHCLAEAEGHAARRRAFHQRLRLLEQRRRNTGGSGAERPQLFAAVPVGEADDDAGAMRRHEADLAGRHRRPPCSANVLDVVVSGPAELGRRRHRRDEHQRGGKQHRVGRHAAATKFRSVVWHGFRSYQTVLPRPATLGRRAVGQFENSGWQAPSAKHGFATPSRLSGVAKPCFAF